MNTWEVYNKGLLPAPCAEFRPVKPVKPENTGDTFTSVHTVKGFVSGISLIVELATESGK